MVTWPRNDSVVFQKRPKVTSISYFPVALVFPDSMDKISKSGLLDADEEVVDEHKSSSLKHNIARYCPSRWLMAHHDPKANIHTLSSHMCLADLNNEGENLLAFVDFKRNSKQELEETPPQAPSTKPPYDCRLRVYRGQQLIYNHFLNDIPSCLLVTATKSPIATQSQSSTAVPSRIGESDFGQERILLTLAINEDIYFYHKLRPFRKLSLEDDESILDSLNRSEVEAWQMVKQNKVDIEAMCELLTGLISELGPQELTSHSNSFVALNTNDDRKNYLLSWRLKRLDNTGGEQIMSMDTVCCAAARLKFKSDIIRPGDLGSSKASKPFINEQRWNQILDLQKNGFVLGTEDRCLLVYEHRSTRPVLESFNRLPSTPDHILVETKSPACFKPTKDLKGLTYKILVSCRDCRIYSLDQPYIVNKDSKVATKELLRLKCNVLDMRWIGDSSSMVDDESQPCFVVACLDRHVYCFNSCNGQCKWMMELELPITCLVCLKIPREGSSRDSGLVGVASQTGRIDFYMSMTGRIVDSIYLNGDHCRAMAFGRFGREDNCLCLATNLGHLLIFILKRKAKFAHGQCLSSAASFASDSLSSCSQYARPRFGPQKEKGHPSLKLNQEQSLPTAFELTKSLVADPVKRALDLLHTEHNCDQVKVRNTLEAELVAPKLQIPSKNRDFVDQIVSQSRHSIGKCKTGEFFVVVASMSTCFKHFSYSILRPENSIHGRTIANSPSSGGIALSMIHSYFFSREEPGK